MKTFKRAWVIVIDSLGVGAEPDAPEFSDALTVNTLGTIAGSKKFHTPMLSDMGLFNIEGITVGEKVAQPTATFGRMRERSRGKDTTIGHWELAGIVSKRPLPTYPHGFPPEIIAKLEKAFGRKILCNLPYSGTKVIHDYGQEHEKTGALIVYTSADSVLQIAAHEDLVPVDELYKYCRQAREIMTGEHSVGRIIARPFVGTYPNYERTPRRHDFSMQPPGETILDALTKAGLQTIGIGKISDIFAGRSVQEHLGVNQDNADGMRKTTKTQAENFHGLCFVNLVDTDMKFGHRRDIDGYANAVSEFDTWLHDFVPKMKEDDVLFITGDHGCDPGAAGTDHTREYVPLLVYGAGIRAGVDLGTRTSFADLGATLAEMFSVPLDTEGQSFLAKIAK